MKRSEKTKEKSNRHFTKAGIWLCLSIVFATFGWSYRDSWAAALLVLSFLMAVFTVRDLFDGYIKRRTSKAEAMYEKSLQIHNAERSL